MRLLHPIAPFITEEVWLALPHDGETIVTANWPDPLEVPEFRRGRTRLRRACSAPSSACATCAPRWGCSPKDRVVLDVPANVPRRTCGSCSRCSFEAPCESAPPAPGGTGDALAAVAVRAPRDLLAARYRKEALHLRSEIDRGEKKLGNEAFVAKAAASVVAKEREKLETYRSELARVEAALDALKEPA